MGMAKALWRLGGERDIMVIGDLDGDMDWELSFIEREVCLKVSLKKESNMDQER